MAKAKKVKPEVEFTDVAGVPLKLGMLVAANHSENTDLRIFKIINFGPKKITLEESFPESEWASGCVRYPHQVCAVDEKYAMMILLSGKEPE